MFNSWSDSPTFSGCTTLTLSLLRVINVNFSPAASQEIWHHTVWRTWLFIAYSDEKWLYYKFSLHHSYNRFLNGWENTLFELRSERVNLLQLCHQQSILPLSEKLTSLGTIWILWQLRTGYFCVPEENSFLDMQVFLNYLEWLYHPIALCT